jgi:hypothetical protein
LYDVDTYFTIILAFLSYAVGQSLGALIQFSMFEEGTREPRVQKQSKCNDTRFNVSRSLHKFVFYTCIAEEMKQNGSSSLNNLLSPKTVILFSPWYRQLYAALEILGYREYQTGNLRYAISPFEAFKINQRKNIL